MTGLRFLLLVALASCGGGDATPQADGGPGTDGGRTADAGVPDGPGGPDAAPAPVCGGLLGATCAATEYCDYPTDSCGVADQTGSCRTRPDACPAIVMPVCACDGMTYANACEAAAAGHDLSAGGGCPAPAGTFACGTTFCAVGTHYCQAGTGGRFDAPPSFTCLPIPAGCGASQTCSCFSGETCGNMCTQDAAGNVTLTCLYP